MKFASSIYTADFARLGEQVREAEQAGVDWMHLDVMDGALVPNITFGTAVCAAVARSSALPCEAHLMVQNPDRFLREYHDAGMRRVIVHVESCPHLFSTIQAIRKHEMEVGITLNPLTPLGVIEDVLPLVDLALIMSVEPGYGGQTYIRGSTQRIKRVRQMLDAIDSKAELQVDGGVNVSTIREVCDAGASIVVVGSALFTPKHSVAHGLAALQKALL